MPSAGANYSVVSDTVKCSLTNFNQVTKSLATQLFKPKEMADSLTEDVTNFYQSGASLFIVDADNNIQHGSNKFYLTSVNISFKERVQLLETLSSAVLSFFGDSVKVYSLGGIALDHPSDEIGNESKYFIQSSLMHLYDTKLRGSKLAESRSIAVLKFLNHTIYGYPINFSTVYSAELDKATQFTMTFVVVSHKLDSSGVVSYSDLEDLTTINLETHARDFQKVQKAINALMLLKVGPGAKKYDIDKLTKNIYQMMLQNMSLYSDDFKTAVTGLLKNAVTEVNSTIKNLKLSDNIILTELVDVSPTIGTEPFRNLVDQLNIIYSQITNIVNAGVR